MPPNKNLWRTYNISIRNPGDTFQPYRISYVSNRHQNDAENPDYAEANLPQFFVSLVNDLNQIPQQDMLDRVRDTTLIPAPLREALPQATLLQMDEQAPDTGYRHLLGDIPADHTNKAWTVFKHNVLDADCCLAQENIEKYNQMTAAAIAEGERLTCPLLFGGGWSNGAGLHEQCLEQAEKIAAWVLPKQTS
ncbi:hypothetical protein CAI21_10870 [Alkalilimnicola ehrlichii]|uniref:Uncharacterized protein n=1 Tax=Alkalilimnicola ehrlichii TaxID=351052 RepID=A0A3E0WW61_9GAMM|nr:hypothetical protein CAI21_10870 [Alkalilimnicola ehrlichii]RFA36167.1 hypothetical protein CAL65_12025 [Alkalilimnicola ehrlichii]